MGRKKKDTITYGVSKQSLINDLLKIKSECMQDKKDFDKAMKAVSLIASLIGYNNGGDPTKDKNNTGGAVNLLQPGAKNEFNFLSAPLQPVEIKPALILPNENDLIDTDMNSD